MLRDIADITTAPMTPAIGAVVRGIDLSQNLSPEQTRHIEELMLRHGLLLFPDQPVSNTELTRFGRCFGPLVEPAIQTEFGDPENPELIVLDQTDPRGAGAEQWHADSTFLETPPKALILRSVLIPQVGGDTCFASMRAAYEGLSDPMKTFLGSLSAVHTIENLAALTKNFSYISKHQDQHDVPPVVHPVVRVHPQTGEMMLNVNSNYTSEILDLRPAESQSLLRHLFEHINSVEYQCRVRWEPNMVALLDNRAAVHCAIPDYRERRVMIRLMVHDTPPSAN